ncbi:MAG: CDP-glycerol glycerophosphotransferase family protein [Sarcina sp.]
MSLYRKVGRKALNIIGRSFTLLPINKKKVMMFSYSGKSYSCNPKYVTESLMENYGDNIKVVWALQDKREKIDLKSVKIVKYGRIKYLYNLATAKVVMTNSRTDELFKKRKNQYYIQSWHSLLRVKQIEKDAESTLSFGYINQAKNDSKKCDLLLSGSKYTTETFQRAFWYDGEILECGTPRNDLLVNLEEEKIKAIKEKNNIKNREKILLYAPTFRNGRDKSIYNLDFKRIKEVLEKKTGDSWVIFSKLHPNLMGECNKLVGSEEVIDKTNYDDIQELLAISDMVISDYSSLIFDYALTERPCFLHTPDLVKYLRAERKFYFNIEKLPFKISKTTEELIYNILNFDKDNYRKELLQFEKSVGELETGNASKVVADRIAKVCG